MYVILHYFAKSVKMATALSSRVVKTTNICCIYFFATCYYHANFKIVSQLFPSTKPLCRFFFLSRTSAFIAFVLIKFEFRFLEFATGELRQFHKYKSVGTLKTLISKPTICHCPLKILCYLPYILEIQNVIVTKIVCRKQKFLRFAECVGQRGSRTGGNSQIIIMGFQDETPLPSRQRVLF